MSPPQGRGESGSPYILERKMRIIKEIFFAVLSIFMVVLLFTGLIIGLVLVWFLYILEWLDYRISKMKFSLIPFALVLLSAPMMANADGSLRAFYSTHTDTFKCRYVTVDEDFHKAYADCFDGDVINQGDSIHVDGFDPPTILGDWSYEVTLNGAPFASGEHCGLDYHEEADSYVHIGLDC